jgi:hypothetical protein
MSVQVETVSLKAGLQDWEMNLIQGIVNQLQTDSKTLKAGLISKRNQINTSRKTMEVRIKFYHRLYILL